MKSRQLLAFLFPFCAVVPALAAPKAPVQRSLKAPFVWSFETLEPRWSYRAKVSPLGTGGASWMLGRDAQNGVLLQTSPMRQREGDFSLLVSRVQKGVSTPLRALPLPLKNGELGLVRVGRTLGVLWNGELKAQFQTDLGGNRFGVAASGNWKLTQEQMQPTEPVVLRDDFMRDGAPESSEAPGVWRVAGNWKTSGTLGPKADASVSPNPFVFRAMGQNESVARAGEWFWRDYNVSASVRAVSPQGDDSPLVAGLDAFGSVRGEVDFRTGVARLLNGTKPLAQSAPFDATLGEWHRMRLEPGPGIVRLLFDGREVVRAKSDLAQGEVALRAQTGGATYVDFDDVRVGAGADVMGDGALPDRLVSDRLMRLWASDASAWKRDAKGVWWHTGDFWQGATLDVPLPQLKEGQGFRFYVGADAGAPNKAALRVELERRDGKIGLIAQDKSGKRAPKTVASSEENRLTLALGEFKTNARSGAIKWNGQTVWPVSSVRGGTKIGIEPTQNGVALPPAPLQPLSLKATTFERDGQAVIGVNITGVSPQIARELGLPDATGVVLDNVETGSPAQRAGLKNGDVVRSANGAKVLDVDTMRAAVGGVRAPATVALEILRPGGEASGLDWATCRASTSGRLDYAFTSAPVDWKPARGKWEVAERWTCSPQWSFFAGQNDEFPLLWSRFALRGDWTLEAFVATPMDLTRGERSPTDLNLSVGDGKSVSSGYSFAFAARERSKNLIWRKNEVVSDTPFEMPPGVGETHQDWFYVRLERRATAKGGVRFRWSVNGKQISEYEDSNPAQAANRLAFWTKNGALSLARVRLWHDGLLPLAPEPRPKLNSTQGVPAAFSPRGSGGQASSLLSKVEDTSGEAIEVENPRDGGDWTLYLLREGFDPAQKPRASFAYRANPGVKLNLYARVEGNWREIAWTAGVSPPDSNLPGLGTIESAVADGKWHSAEFDFKAALERNGLSGKKIESLALAAPARDYLRQGLGGNSQGAKFWLRDFKLGS